MNLDIKTVINRKLGFKGYLFLNIQFNLNLLVKNLENSKKY